MEQAANYPKITKDTPSWERIIFPLDVSTLERAGKLVERLKSSVGVFKIGLELFVSAGPEVVKTVRTLAPGRGIFLDLKFHDIPATVAGATRSASDLGADFLTVHTSDRAMLEAAVGAGGGRTRILGVTVLTSLSKESMAEAGIDPKYADPGELVAHRARLARLAGCAGVVCSGREAKRVKDEFGSELLVITPGIRGKEDEAGDQKRVTTAYGAVRDGADYIVVGRPIRTSPNPAEAAAKIAEEVERGLRDREAL